ncbi:flagellar hook protein FlgE [Lamprobacter modestohalophilus]|uniref:flagellar hook protein FlgE n=1 Tax=Lamprobacter modestohalophilus TaxID=1064514 RepID=UPI002ADEC178|nr:flagellar hook protein FlgE [Lamprobacter modestohalophilus]MEA1050089.1 flagellar hook protein FlgE [Lamprobacter modestohalophilus]
MSFSQALSGLRGQAENIKVISNNIANSQTVGFKNGRTSFADIFAGASPVGLGVRVAGISQDFRSGDLENTGRELDLAIAGQGFFRMEKGNGEVVYSRNGEFNQDQDGFLINSTGQYLTGFAMNEGDEDYPFSDVIAGGAPERLRIPPNDIPANATEEASAIYNLDAGIDATDPNLVQEATVFTDFERDPEAVANIGYHFSSPFTAYDSLGNARTITTYFRKDPAEDNLWQANIAFDGVIVGFPDEDNPRDPANAESAGDNAFTLQFGTDGQLLEDEDRNIIGINGDSDRTEIEITDEVALGGAAPFEGENVIDYILAGTTQFNNNSVQNSLAQDGYTSGTLTGLEVTDDGRVIRIFTNEERRDAGQIVLTNFINPEGLMPDGDNAWRQSIASGEPVLGVAGTGLFGTVESQTLENSNVDLAQQLVDMIVAQRAYQANSSSIGTQDEMLQTVINL